MPVCPLTLAGADGTEAPCQIGRPWRPAAQQDVSLLNNVNEVLPMLDASDVPGWGPEHSPVP